MLSIWLPLILNLFLIVAVSGETDEKVVYSSVVYSYNGDRTPLVLPRQDILTPLGARQLESAGTFFRQRYLAIPQGADEVNTTINGIFNDRLDNSQVFIMSIPDQYAVASAQAFMQGFSPPTFDATSVLSNGTVAPAPLGGYQYPQIITVSSQDPNSVYVAGDRNCPEYHEARADYAKSPESVQTKLATQDFYTGFRSDILDGVVENPSYDSAYLIFDYLNYGHTHNKTIREKLSDNDLARARGLADQQIHAINGNTSANASSSRESIQTIAGQTLAAAIAGLLADNIDSNGALGKINLLFGSFQPMVAFAALAQLPKINPDFYGVPDYGSSMVIEMYSDKSNGDVGYPDPDDLYIRFLFRNGTDPSSALHTYPLFGGSDTQLLSLHDFLGNLSSFAISSAGYWCLACQSDSDFCATYLNSSSDGNVQSSPSSGGVTNTMKPAVAGVIGAAVCLAIIAITIALFMVVGGVRLHRSKAKRRSELGGFKAGEKLPSDQDLPRGQSKVGASIIKDEDNRVKSWELKERDMVEGRRPSYDEDELGNQHAIQPTKADERV